MAPTSSDLNPQVIFKSRIISLIKIWRREFSRIPETQGETLWMICQKWTGEVIDVRKKKILMPVGVGIKISLIRTSTKTTPKFCLTARIPQTNLDHQIKWLMPPWTQLLVITLNNHKWARNPNNNSKKMKREDIASKVIRFNLMPRNHKSMCLRKIKKWATRRPVKSKFKEQLVLEGFQLIKLCRMKIYPQAFSSHLKKELDLISKTISWRNIIR